MSYNGSGTFQINTSGQPVVTGTSISSTVFNALTADLATGLSTAITKDGQTTTTARIPFALGINSTLVTDATNTTSGSIITAGGVGIAKALYVGTTANVAGAVTLGGVATFSAQPIFSSLTASSAVATDASKGLVSVTNTGTGNNVLATGPTISGPTISDGTANGVAYLNGSKVLTTGSALVFDGTNLLVGTTSAISKLTVEGSSDIRITVRETSNAVRADLTCQTSQAQVGTTSNHPFDLVTNGSICARIDTSGNLLVGTTSASGRLSIDSAGTTSATYIIFGRNSAASNKFTVRSDGAGFLDSAAWAYGSDATIKENIEYLEPSNCLSLLLNAKPAKFDYIEGQKANYGYIAQDVQKWLPEAVSETPNGKLGLQDGFINAIGTGAIQALHQLIQEQQTIITTLTDRITALEARNG